MNKNNTILFFLCLLFFSVRITAQNHNVCAYAKGNIPNDTVKICEGDSVILASGTIAFGNNFNNQSLGNQWISNTSGISWNPPCTPLNLPANGAVYWFGNNATQREISSKSLNTLYGDSWVEWDMKYGTVINMTDCDPPDDPSEGVHLMYSINNGYNWIQFPDSNLAPSGVYGNIGYVNGSGGYWTPVAGNIATGPYYSWNHYKTPLPFAAKAANTKIKLCQFLSTGNTTDNWGIDNIMFACKLSPLTFLWSNGNATMTVFPTTTQWYFASKQDSTQNPPIVLYDSVLVIVYPKPLKPIINNIGDSLFSSATSGNQWYFGSYPIIGATNAYYNAIYSGDYYVYVTNQHECVSEKSNIISMNIVGITNFDLQPDILISPNPTHDFFTINSKTKINYVELFDINGKLMLSINKPCIEYQFNIKQFPKAIYFSRIYTDNQVTMLKIIKY